MQPIPPPELLNPDRVLRDDRQDMTAEDHRSQAQLLDKALHESCAYAQQLWDDLNAVRGYLLDSLPPDPRHRGAHDTLASSPTGPDDELGWQNWINAFSSVTSVLCGPRGDSGFGRGQALEEAQLRRIAPASTIPAEQTDRAMPSSRAGSAAEVPTARLAPPDQPARDQRRVAKGVGTAILAVLAIRGLRPRTRRAF